MLINVGLVWRKPEVGPAEFTDIWSGPYADLVLAQPEVVFYAQCHVTGEVTGTLPALADYGSSPAGIALVGFDNARAAATMRTSPALTEHAPVLMDGFCERVISVFSKAEHLAPIASNGFALFTTRDGQSLGDAGGIEFSTTALGDGPHPFTRMILSARNPMNTSVAASQISMPCGRKVMRMH